LLLFRLAQIIEPFMKNTTKTKSKSTVKLASKRSVKAEASDAIGLHKKQPSLMALANSIPLKKFPTNLEQKELLSKGLKCFGKYPEHYLESKEFTADCQIKFLLDAMISQKERIRILSQFRGRPKWESAFRVFLQRMYTPLADAYPHLKADCEANCNELNCVFFYDESKMLSAMKKKWEAEDRMK
jgi:hypothetical protein